MEASIWLLPMALGLDLLLGDPRVAWHPVCLIAMWCRTMEKLWKCWLGKTFWAGCCAWICSSVPVLTLTLGFLWIVSLLVPGEWGVGWGAVVVIYMCMAPRSLAEHGWRVMKADQAGNLTEARQCVSMIVGRDTATLDRHGVLRACIESVAENLTDGVISTIVWASIGIVLAGPEGGALGAMFHRTSNLMDALWGKKNDEYRYFGTWAARMDDVLNWLPARLSLILIAWAAVIVPGCSASKALRIGWKYRYEHASPNSAWSEAAFAGALNLKLSGPISYKGVPAPYPYIGEGLLQATALDLRRAIILMGVSTFLAVASGACLLWLIL